VLRHYAYFTLLFIIMLVVHVIYLLL